MNILAVVPARAGSKGVPGKNLRRLAGQPLVAHVLRALRQCSTPMRTVVSCDSEAIAETARAEGADVPFLRPAELATDDVPIPAAVQHAMRHCDAEGWRADLVLSVQPTNPLLLASSIDAALERMIAAPAVDSVVSVALIRHFHPFRSYRLDGDGTLLPLTRHTSERFLQKQDRPPAYGFAGAFYLRRRALLEEWAGEGFALGTRCLGHVVSEEEAVDIDTEVDFLLAEILMQRRQREACADPGRASNGL